MTDPAPLIDPSVWLAIVAGIGVLVFAAGYFVGNRM